jgi:hypothetical protein
MPTEKPTITFVADDGLLRRIKDFRFEERLDFQSEAIRRLIEEALKKHEKKAKK